MYLYYILGGSAGLSLLLLICIKVYISHKAHDAARYLEERKILKRGDKLYSRMTDHTCDWF